MIRFVRNPSALKGFEHVSVERDGEILAGFTGDAAMADRAETFFAMGFVLAKRGHEYGTYDPKNT